MTKHRKTKFVNALDLELENVVEFGGSDYRVVSLSLNGEENVVVVLLPITAGNLSFRKRAMCELRFIVPQTTPFITLK